MAKFQSSTSSSEEASLLLDMIHQHSQYLPTLLGPSSPLKTSLLHLLTAIATTCPSTCSLDQVPLLLSGYTGTLHESDTALLSLLAVHEAAGLDLHQYKPFMFGPVAVKHYSIHKAATGLSKMPKISEVLSLLNPETMTT